LQQGVCRPGENQIARQIASQSHTHVASSPGHALLRVWLGGRQRNEHFFWQRTEESSSAKTRPRSPFVRCCDPHHIDRVPQDPEARCCAPVLGAQPSARHLGHCPSSQCSAVTPVDADGRISRNNRACRMVEGYCEPQRSPSLKNKNKFEKKGAW
jgi:hypothetical protein